MTVGVDIVSLFIFRDDSISTSFDLDTFLVKSFSQQIKEVNVDTGEIRYLHIY